MIHGQNPQESFLLLRMFLSNWINLPRSNAVGQHESAPCTGTGTKSMLSQRDGLRVYCFKAVETASLLANMSSTAVQKQQVQVHVDP